MSEAATIERQTRDGVLQAQVLAALVATHPQVQTTRWRDKTFEAFRETPDVEHAEDDFRACLNSMNLMPDAFAVDRDEMRLDFFEVEITSQMTDTKMQVYADFLTLLHYYGINFSLFSVNQHGHINEVWLAPHFVELLKRRNGLS